MLVVNTSHVKTVAKKVRLPFLGYVQLCCLNPSPALMTSCHMAKGSPVLMTSCDIYGQGFPIPYGIMSHGKGFPSPYDILWHLWPRVLHPLWHHVTWWRVPQSLGHPVTSMAKGSLALMTSCHMVKCSPALVTSYDITWHPWWRVPLSL